MNREQTQSPATTKARAGEDNELTARAHEAVEQVRNAASKRVESVRHTAEVARGEAAEKVRKLGQVVRKIGEHMRIEEQVYIADHANSAGQRIDSVASYIEAAELKTLVQDAEALSKRQPALWFGGAVLLGLAAGRFLKSPVSASTQLAKSEPAESDAAVVIDTRPRASSQGSAGASKTGGKAAGSAVRS